jgi:hypothetical protein
VGEMLLSPSSVSPWPRAAASKAVSVPIELIRLAIRTEAC